MRFFIKNITLKSVSLLIAVFCLTSIGCSEPISKAKEVGFWKGNNGVYATVNREEGGDQSKYKLTLYYPNWGNGALEIEEYPAKIVDGSMYYNSGNKLNFTDDSQRLIQYRAEFDDLVFIGSIFKRIKSENHDEELQKINSLLEQ